jgi:hypothetical protein
MKFLIFAFLVVILAFSFSANFDYKRPQSNSKSNVKHFDQVTDFTIPPWKMYPELDYKSLGWRMGYGEYYIQRWHKYFRSLNSKQRLDYKTANPELESWIGFYAASEARYSKLEQSLVQ